MVVPLVTRPLPAMQTWLNDDDDDEDDVDVELSVDD